MAEISKAFRKKIDEVARNARSLRKHRVPTHLRKLVSCKKRCRMYRKTVGKATQNYQEWLAREVIKRIHKGGK